jgi:hypothetical protein
MSRQQLIQQIIANFGKRVIQQSRSNLTKNKKNATSSLYRSLDFKSNVKGQSLKANSLWRTMVCSLMLVSRKDILCQST